MGDFFTSPRESELTSLFSAAKTGRTPFDPAITGAATTAKRGIRTGTNEAVGSRISDILSQAESGGVTFSSGLSDLVGKEESLIRGRGEQRETAVDTAALQARVGALSDVLRLGASGLSASSTAGDLLAGLTTLANIFGGVATGLGPLGIGVFGGDQVNPFNALFGREPQPQPFQQRPV